MIISPAPIRPKNPHLQSFLASSRLRLWRLPKHPDFRTASQSVMIETPLATLEAHCSIQSGDDLVVIIHGWEGSANSTYVQLLAHRLYQSGCSVVRLNMRDHGDTHHLNDALFHSCRIEEMVQALDWIVEQHPDKQVSLTGFSLGGNFALRMASRSHKPLKKVVAVSPPINPQNAMAAIQDAQVYQQYFLKKWRKSLQIKQDHFPHLFEGHDWQKEQSLAQLTADFVIRHTEYDSATAYFNGYRISPEVVKGIQSDATIISSWDDPVIPFSDLSTIDRLPQVKIIATPHGGHCGFIQGWSMRSWVEDYIVTEICHEST